MFVDSDDAITPTALEELYPIAKKFDADLIYCEKYYQIEMGEKFTTDKNFLKESVAWDIQYDFVTEPKLISDDIVERVRYFVSRRFSVTTWDYFIRRDLIAKHRIDFPVLKYSEDNFFSLFLVCLSKNLVRVPNKIYIYRRRSGSKMTNTSIEIEIRRCADQSFQGIPIIDKFIEENSFFKKHPELKYALFEFASRNQFNVFAPLYAKFPAEQLDSIIRKEIEKVDDKIPLAAFIFARMTLFNLQLNRQSAVIQKMNAHIQQQNQTLQQQQSIIKNQEDQIKQLKNMIESLEIP